MVIFYKKWKKYNEIKKNEMNLNNRKMTNRPPYPVGHSNIVHNIQVHNYFYFFALNTHCAHIVSLSEKSKYLSVRVKEMWNQCKSVFPNTHVFENRKMKPEKETEEGTQRGASMGRNTAGSKNKRSPDRLSLPDQNTIMINIILYFLRNGKNIMKFN